MPYIPQNHTLGRPRTYPSIMREIKQIEEEAFEVLLQAYELKNFMDEETRETYSRLKTLAATIKP